MDARDRSAHDAGPRRAEAHHPERDEVEHPGPGVRQGAPRPSAAGIALGIGAVWGLLGYSVLWEGTPVAVDRPFVQSVHGTFALLPVRAVLWGIHRAELAVGRPFDLSQNHWWIALAAGAVGAAITVTVVLAAARIVRRLRPPTGARFDTTP